MINEVNINNNKNTIYNHKLIHNPYTTENFTSHVPRVLYKSVEKANIWHKYPLKLMVYSNDVGEAMRPVIGNVMARLSWIPAVSYTLLALNNGNKKDNLAKELAFQGIASFLIPFLMLKTARAGASKAIEKLPKAMKTAFAKQTAKMPEVDKFIRRFDKNNQSGYKNIAVSGMSIGVLLACVKPIDDAVKKVLNKHFA
ncbi:TPA: hypothetical protein IAC10_05820 [Candidatus Scatousia excrementigallinarum]|uniref:Uncharacterized protein n=1 Tax=Candidatus Scatousia excrementigallinarum TaxID=2840935 RepID=A0A9D1EZ42_9BACT|nr:hypothetical protein [Candidatus Scatousia excrementigallinarum]